MKDEKLLLEGIYAMLEEMSKNPSRSESTTPAAAPTVDLSEITMLIKHWGMRSTKQASDMEEAIVAKLDSIAASADKPTIPDERIGRIIEILQQPPAKPQPQRHYHVIDLKSSKVVKFILIQWLIIILFAVANAYLTHWNMGLRDSDLKYRYVKSVNSDNDFIHHLEKVFKYDRDRKEIRSIRKKVKEYEDEVKRRAERIEIGEEK